VFVPTNPAIADEIAAFLASKPNVIVFPAGEAGKAVSPADYAMTVLGEIKERWPDATWLDIGSALDIRQTAAA